MPYLSNQDASSFVNQIDHYSWSWSLEYIFSRAVGDEPLLDDVIGVELQKCFILASRGFSAPSG